ncbi:hypothetical protein F4604DRAFT_1598862 [Suillus subluteus]|nr:hypothetical protein F4604DRAFT_1598862 [Suillus subluteus]
MLSLATIFSGILSRPQLLKLSFDQVTNFVSQTSLLKCDIMHTQPLGVPSDIAPDILPHTIVQFSAESLTMNAEDVLACWDVFKDCIWSLPSDMEPQNLQREAFEVYGHPLGIGSRVLFPPSDSCTNPSCDTLVQMKQGESHNAIIFTLEDGVCCLWAVKCYCPGCNTMYHHNYSMNGGVRTYYEGLPEYVEVANHHYVATNVVHMVSAMNCAWNYDLSHACLERSSILDGAWPFSPQLTTENVWDGFVILSLLNNCRSRGVRLHVHSKIEQKYRFTLAMEECNACMVTEGLPELPHYCDLCMRTYDDNDNKTHKVQAIITDGLSMGHPCCGVFRCTEPLVNNCHRFCPMHHHLHLICAINNCSQPVVADTMGKPTKTCNDPMHQEMERLNNEAANALHQQHCEREIATRLLETSATYPNRRECNIRPKRTANEATPY